MKKACLFFLSWAWIAFGEIHAVLLAGGGGTRLWPLSTNAFPKQFIDFGDGESLLQKTIGRLLLIEGLGEIAIATSKAYEPLVRLQIEPYESKASIRILIEPERKNTAPAIAFACKALMSRAKPQDAVLVVPSDHIMEPEEDFAAAVRSVLPSIAAGKIVTFGIRPTKPETGYGYLEMGAPFDPAVMTVEKFIEKPNKERAEKLIQFENVYWNAGIFAFSLQTFWSELSLYAPKIASLSSLSLSEMEHAFSEMPDISIDFALMEKSKRIVGCPLEIDWSDVGSWDSMYEIAEKDEDGNVLKGKVCHLNAKNNLILSKKRLIAAVDIEDLLIIETDDAILISKRGESQKVKPLLEKLGSVP